MITAQRHKSFLELFPPPEFLLLSTAGIALTEEGVRFAQLKRKDLIGEPILLIDKAPNASAAGLKEIADRHNLHYVRASLPDDKTYIFTTTIDKVPEASLVDAVAFIIEENAPVSLADSVFDFIVIPYDDPGVIKVAVSVVPKKVISMAIELFESAGLTPISFDIESQAIARAVVAPWETRTELIINLGAKKTGFYVVEDQCVEFSTALTHDSSLTDEAILRDLKGEMRKVFSFWDTRLDSRRRPQKKIERVLLCGERSSDEKRVAALMADFAVEHALSDASVNLGGEHNVSLDYAAAVGLALSTYSNSHV